MSSDREPLWLVPANQVKPRERLRSIGPVGDLSRQSLIETSCLSQSLSHLDQSNVGLTPVAAIAPLNKNNNLQSAPVTPLCHNYSINADDETTSLPDEIRSRSVSDRLPSNTDYDPDPTVRLAWTPAAPRRARVHQRDYGSASSIDHFNPEFNPENNQLAKNQSQPYLLNYQDTTSQISKKENEPVNKRMKNFLSHSRERLDNFVGKFSKQKAQDNGLESAASVGAGLDNYRAMQQKKRREGTLSPRSTEYQYMIKRFANIGNDDTSSGFDGDVSEVSSLSRERSFSSRRRWFAHYDCESTAFDFIPVSRLLDSSSKRSVIASGASAAIFTSALASEVGSEEELRRLQGTIKVDRGCGRSNQLVASCPQFRNEIGGELPLPVASVRPEHVARGSHIPCVDSGRAAALFESVPRPTSGFLIECPTPGQDYYKNHFLNREHANYICSDDRYGPICVSIRREKPDERSRKEKSVYIYRIIVRTASLIVLKGSILEEMIPLGRHSTTVSHRDVLMHILPEINIQSMRRLNPDAPQLLINLDSKSEQNGIKIGVLLCKAGQSTEEEMYNNQYSTPLFDDFLNVIGTKVKLEGFDQFRAGLDVRGNSTGEESVFTTHRNYQIMFHVSTMLPYSSVNRQQVDRKRHIGNDVITIIFQEPGAGQFSPALSGVRSQFQHIFVIVRAFKAKSTGSIQYAISVARAKCVPAFGPLVPAGPCFTANDLFRDFLLTKVINGHLATPKVGKFGALGKEMRHKYLTNLIENNQLESSSVEGSSSRFSILPFRRVEKRRQRIPAEIESRGGLIWPIEMLIGQVQHSLVLSVSHELLAIVVPDTDVAERLNRVPGTALFAIPPRAILGWTPLGDMDLILYYGTGDSFQFTVRKRHPNDVNDLVTRLECASRGKMGLYNPAIQSKEINVTRPVSGGQLGFHVSYEGFVNQVDSGSAASRSGLLKGSKIVALQSRSLSQLTHDQMISILRTDPVVTLRVLPPIGIKAQHRFTPRELSNSIPRIPIIDDLSVFDDDETDHSLEKSESIPSILSNEEQMINDIARSHAEIAHSLRSNVKMRQPKKRSNVSPKRQKELFEIKRKSFEAGEKRLSSSGLSEELPRVLSREASPIRTVTPQITAVPITPTRVERRSWHGASLQNSFVVSSGNSESTQKQKVSDNLTAAELLNVDKFEQSPNDTCSSGERKSTFRSPLKLQTKSTPETTRRSMPRHLLSLNRPRNEIVFFKANPQAPSQTTKPTHHQPSRRKETTRRNRSVPRSSDKVTQDLLRLITEPIKPPTTTTTTNTTVVNQDSSDEDQKRDNPEHLPEADRQYVSFQNKKERVGRNKRRKSLQADPVTDERLHRIEKTLREMQLKLDEEQSRNHDLESQVKTLRNENYKMKMTKTHKKQDYV